MSCKKPFPFPLITAHGIATKLSRAQVNFLVAAAETNGTKPAIARKLRIPEFQVVVAREEIFETLGLDPRGNIGINSTLMAVAQTALLLKNKRAKPTYRQHGLELVS